MTSIAGVIATANRGTYPLAKAGVKHLTAVAAFEWGPHNIRINAIAPGSILSEEIKATIFASPAAREKYLSRTPLNRFGEPEDVEYLVTFLASDRSRFLTGQTIVLDGGYILGTD